MQLSDPPRLRPQVCILDRPDQLLQVGLRDRALLLHRRAGQLISALDGRTSIAGLSARSGLRRNEVLQVLQALDAAGHLQGRPSPTLTPVTAISPSTLVVGDNELAGELTRAVLQTGNAATQRRLRRQPELPDLAAADLTLLALSSAETDRALTAALQAAGQPHLILDWTAAWVRVGPLVIPGSTPCLRCIDLHRCDADPAWPWLAAQLARPLPLPSPGLRQWLRGHTVCQLLAHFHAQLPVAVGGSTEVDSRDWLPLQRRWSPHPDCDCGAAG